jgi:GntR family transcriptional regulator/MocR family aminotransferase
MREVYRARRDALLAATEDHGRDRIRLGPSNGGMHIVGWLPASTDVRALRERAAAHALYLRDVGICYAGTQPGPGVVLNFASAPTGSIRRGIRLLCTLI